MPTNLPPSSTGEDADGSKSKYVVSQSGHAAHPDEIIASCRALQEHLQKLQDNADATLRQWQEDMRTAELAEKRRVAPGWLDREEKILQPERAHNVSGPQAGSTGLSQLVDQGQSTAPAEISMGTDEGDAIDRAFGGMKIR